MQEENTKISTIKVLNEDAQQYIKNYNDNDEILVLPKDQIPVVMRNQYTGWPLICIGKLRNPSLLHAGYDYKADVNEFLCCNISFVKLIMKASLDKNKGIFVYDKNKVKTEEYQDIEKDWRNDCKKTDINDLGTYGSYVFSFRYNNESYVIVENTQGPAKTKKLELNTKSINHIPYVVINDQVYVDLGELVSGEHKNILKDLFKVNEFNNVTVKEKIINPKNILKLKEVLSGKYVNIAKQLEEFSEELNKDKNDTNIKIGKHFNLLMIGLIRNSISSEKDVDDFVKKLDEELIGKEPMSPNVKALVGGIIGALIGLVGGFVIGGVIAGLATGGVGAIPGALAGAGMGCKIGFGVGGIVGGAIGAKIGFWHGQKTQASHKEDEKNMKESNFYIQAINIADKVKEICKK